MKKILVIILLPLLLASCGEQGIYSTFETCYNKAHFISAHRCIEISEVRHEESGRVRVKTKNGSFISGHTSEIILIDGACPYCEANL